MGERREKENKRQNGEIREERRQTNADLFLRELAISKETCKATIYYIDISRKQPIRKTWSRTEASGPADASEPFSDPPEFLKPQS